MAAQSCAANALPLKSRLQRPVRRHAFFKGAQFYHPRSPSVKEQALTKYAVVFW
jgi:cytochrome c peroxidase